VWSQPRTGDSFHLSDESSRGRCGDSYLRLWRVVGSGGALALLFACESLRLNGGF
jgi:hypothetical protein